MFPFLSPSLFLSIPSSLNMHAFSKIFANTLQTCWPFTVTYLNVISDSQGILLRNYNIISRPWNRTLTLTHDLLHLRKMNRTSPPALKTSVLFPASNNVMNDCLWPRAGPNVRPRTDWIRALASQSHSDLGLSVCVQAVSLMWNAQFFCCLFITRFRLCLLAVLLQKQWHLLKEHAMCL